MVGNQLSLKIYVYEENEIDGLKELMYGRDGQITVDSCFKGQGGTQVKIHQMLLKSRFRTLKKEEADLFFVPTYVKCVRMMGGLTVKEINSTYVKEFYNPELGSRIPAAFDSRFSFLLVKCHIFDYQVGAATYLFSPVALELTFSVLGQNS
ncbi:hypothetical protein MKW92_038029 [Papaver armeniacum]|nr:hypothetical protein MKW92_038029 [Papaver armeniacum]